MKWYFNTLDDAYSELGATAFDLSLTFFLLGYLTSSKLKRLRLHLSTRVFLKLRSSSFGTRLSHLDINAILLVVFLWSTIHSIFGIIYRVIAALLCLVPRIFLWFFLLLLINRCFVVHFDSSFLHSFLFPWVDKQEVGPSMQRKIGDDTNPEKASSGGYHIQARLLSGVINFLKTRKLTIAF